MSFPGRRFTASSYALLAVEKSAAIAITSSTRRSASSQSSMRNGRSSSRPVIVHVRTEREHCQLPSYKLPPFFAGKMNCMKKKHTRAKRPRAGATPRSRESVLNSRMSDNPVEAQMERRWLRVQSSFQRVFGTAGDLRSFQIYKTDSGYQTVYLNLKDPPIELKAAPLRN